jgi:hypothetical protein
MLFYALNVHVDMKKIVTYLVLEHLFNNFVHIYYGKLFLVQRLCVMTLVLGSQPTQGHGKLRARSAT